MCGGRYWSLQDVLSFCWEISIIRHFGVLMLTSYIDFFSLRTEHDDHWASVRSPETSVPIDRNPDPEKQPLARNYGHKYLMGETDKVDRGRNRSQVENEYPIDTNDAVGE